MPTSLHRTWASLALASAAVLLVALLAGRDFLRDVYATCPSALETQAYAEEESPRLDSVVLDASDPSGSNAATETPASSFRLRFDAKLNPRPGYGGVSEYSSVRIEHAEVGPDGKPCSCGTVPIYLSGESPYDLRLYRVEGRNSYVVKGRASSNDLRPASEVRVAFAMKHGFTSQLQRERVFTARHLSVLVVLFALGALVVALVRSRRAMSYALRMHAWTEARLTASGTIEGDDGGALGTLEQGRFGALPCGPILVSPEALTTAGLYRDMPIVARQNVAEGDHARWSSGTLLRLRDARSLAVVSTLCTVVAFAARALA